MMGGGGWAYRALVVACREGGGLRLVLVRFAGS